MKRLALILAVNCILLLASVAFAGGVIAPSQDLSNGCKRWTLCSANAAAANCGGSGTETYAKLEGMYVHTAMATWVGSADAWTIKLYNVASGGGYSTQRSLINASGDITSSNPSFSWAGPMGDVHAARGVYTADTVTLIVDSCPVAK